MATTFGNLINRLISTESTSSPVVIKVSKMSSLVFFIASVISIGENLVINKINCYSYKNIDKSYIDDFCLMDVTATIQRYVFIFSKKSPTSALIIARYILQLEDAAKGLSICWSVMCLFPLKVQ